MNSVPFLTESKNEPSIISTINERIANLEEYLKVLKDAKKMLEEKPEAEALFRLIANKLLW